MWCHVYDHRTTLPDGHALACDFTFMISRKLKGKIVKFKETTLEDGPGQGTHPCSEMC